MNHRAGSREGCRMKPIVKRHGRRTGAARRSGAALCLVIGALATGASLGVSIAQDQPLRRGASGVLEACRPIVSLEGRVVMEQWALAGSCEKPTRTRVTDRFLGYSCLESDPQSVACRPFVPPPESRAFDSSRIFRCVDVAVADSEMGIAITRMREWVSPSRECDWGRSLDLPAMEVDFTRREVCAGGLCIAAGRLSLIGQLRLRHLIGKALRDLDMTPNTKSTR
jgi:hypothetical protein